MAVYNQFLVNLQTPQGSVQVTINAFDSGTAARIAKSMIPGSTVTMVQQINRS